MAQISLPEETQFFGKQVFGKIVNVLYMNPQVDDNEFPEYRPGEMAMVGFNVEGGMLTRLTKLIDPGIIPEVLGAQAGLQSSRYVYPPPLWVVQPAHTKDYYKGIVTKFEKILRETRSDDSMTLFASEKNVEKYTMGMKWLYMKAGMKFGLRIQSLERWVRYVMMVGSANFRDSDPILDLEKMGRLLDPTPKRNEDMHRLTLACHFHQDRVEEMPPPIREWRNNLREEDRPNTAFRECALHQAQKQVYLALKLLTPYILYNPHELIEGNHIPPNEERPVDQKFDLDLLLSFVLINGY